MTKTSSFAALLIGGLLCGGTAHAQPVTGPDSLQGRLERLESGVAALGGTVQMAQAYPSQTQTAQMAPSLAADFEIRLQNLERSLAELTGRYEEATYQISQLKDRLERINNDMDFRLKDLESRGGGAMGGGRAGGGAMADSALPPEPSARKADPAPEKKTQTAAVSSLPANASPDKQYEHAFELLRQADYEKAEKAFQDFLAKHKGHQLAGNAQYWLGETYYVRGKYPEAAVAFAEGVQKFPKNSKAGDNLLKLGMTLQQLNQKKEACTAYNQLIQKFPDASASVKRRADTERKRLNCTG